MQQYRTANPLPKPPWSVANCTLQTWKLTNGIDEIYVWSTTSHYRVMRTLKSFGSLAVCDTIEEAFEAANYYLNRFAQGYIA